MFKKSLDYGQAGDNIGALLRGVKRDDVQRGQVLAQPNTVKTYKKFEVRRKTKFSTRHLVSTPVDTLLLNTILDGQCSKYAFPLPFHSCTASIAEKTIFATPTVTLTQRPILSFGFVQFSNSGGGLHFKPKRRRPTHTVLQQL
jgi:hypothetical protein